MEDMPPERTVSHLRPAPSALAYSTDYFAGIRNHIARRHGCTALRFASRAARRSNRAYSKLPLHLLLDCASGNGRGERMPSRSAEAEAPAIAYASACGPSAEAFAATLLFQGHNTR